MIIKIPTVPLLNVKTGAGIIVHTIKKLPYIRGATIIILYLSVAKYNTHLLGLKLF